MEVSHGGTGTCGQRFGEYKCREFLFFNFFFRNETMGLYVLTRLN